MGPPNASTLQVPDCVQYEPGSQSMSRAQVPGVQCPVAVSQVSGAVQVMPFAQPGTHCPAWQMFAGAPTHSKSELQLTPASVAAGQPACPDWQQWPVWVLHASPAGQVSVTVQPATHVWV